MPNDTIPLRRVKDAQSAMGICQELNRRDALSSLNRRDYWAAIDGEVPYSQARLEEQGLGHSANFNDLTGDGLRNSALASYIDLTESVPHLAEFDLDIEDQNERKVVAQIFAEEFDWFHEQWEFEETLLRVADGFVVDGVSVGYWSTRWNPCWESAYMSDFKLPRNTKVGERNIKTCKFGDFIDAGDLYDYIRDEKKAKALGWNVAVCKRLIVEASESYNPRQTWTYQWDKIQEEIKENDLWYSYGGGYRQIAVDKLFVREFNGRYSLYIVPVDTTGTSEFLFKGWSKYDNVSEVLVTFTSGVGNGTYHSIRGLGWKMFPYLQALNRTNCQMVNGIMLAGSIVAQPKDAAAMEEFQMAQLGGFTFVRGDVSFPTIPPTNVASQVLPVQNNLKMQLQNNTGRYQSRAVTPDGAERSATEVRYQASQESVLSAADMILFYRPLKRIYKEEFRRLTNPKVTKNDPGGELIFEFRKRLLKRGIDSSFFKLVKDVSPVKAIGNGSATQRIQAQDRIVQLSSQFDEAGRTNAIYDAVAATPGVGYANAARYVQLPGERPPADDIYAAESENDSFFLGRPRQILGTDNHWIHAAHHLDFLDNVAQMLVRGQADPFQSVTTLNIGLPHVREHYEMLALDQSRQPEAKQIKQRLQQLNAIAQQQSQKLERQMQQEQEQPPEGSIDPELEQKLLEKDALFEQKSRHKEMQAEQQRRLTDLKAANKLTFEAVAAKQKREGLSLAANA